MVMKRIVPIFAAALVSAAPIAYAASSAVTPEPSAATPTAPAAKMAPAKKVMHLRRNEEEGRAWRESKAEVKAFEESTVPIQQAIATAQKEVGGKAINADFEHRGDRLEYHMWVVKNDRVTKVTVDAMSGKVVHKSRSDPARAFDREDQKEMSLLTTATTSLMGATEIAQKQAGGKVMEAALEDNHGTIAYELSVVKNGAVQKLLVGINSGKVA